LDWENEIPIIIENPIKMILFELTINNFSSRKYYYS
jgi:hypothetical protein